MNDTPRSDRWLRGHDHTEMTLDAYQCMQTLERELADALEQRNGWREAAYALAEALPPSWEALQPPAEQLRKFKEMVALQNEKTKKLLDIADKHSKMYP